MQRVNGWDVGEWASVVVVRRAVWRRWRRTRVGERDDACDDADAIARGSGEREHGRREAAWVELRGGAERERSVRRVRRGRRICSERPKPRARRVCARPSESTTSRASISSGGAESNGPSEKPSISADGRVVVFPSTATNSSPPTATDSRTSSSAIARRERRGGSGRAEQEANGPSLPRWSAPTAASRLLVGGVEPRGRRPERRPRRVLTDRAVTGRAGEHRCDRRARQPQRGLLDRQTRADDPFRWYAPNLVLGDWNGVADVFVHDREAGATERVNVSSSGIEANAATFRGMVSGDGRYVGSAARR